MELRHEKVRLKIKTAHKSRFDTRTINSKLHTKNEKRYTRSRMKHHAEHTSDSMYYATNGIVYHILCDKRLVITGVLRTYTREFPSHINGVDTINTPRRTALTASIFAQIDPKKTGAIPFFIGNQLTANSNIGLLDGNPGPAKILNTNIGNKAASPTAMRLASAGKNVLKRPKGRRTTTQTRYCTSNLHEMQPTDNTKRLN